MKYRITKYLVWLTIAVGCAFAQETTLGAAAIEQGVNGAVSSVTNPAARLYQQAAAEKLQGHPQAAIQLAARAVALHYQDIEWLQRNELLCAELYADLGLTNAAVATVRQIESLYKGTEISKKANALRSKIESGMSGTPE